MLSETCSRRSVSICTYPSSAGYCKHVPFVLLFVSFRIYSYINVGIKLIEMTSEMTDLLKGDYLLWADHIQSITPSNFTTVSLTIDYLKRSSRTPAPALVIHRSYDSETTYYFTFTLPAVC